MWPTQVRCPIGTSEVSRAIRPVSWTVVSRVVPPAPYVTETNVGAYGSSSRIAVQSCSAPASSRGGMNSNEIDRSPWRIRSAMLATRASGMPPSLGSAGRADRRASTG